MRRVVTYNPRTKGISLSHITIGTNIENYGRWIKEKEILQNGKVLVALVGGSSSQGSLGLVSDIEKFFKDKNAQIIVRDLYGDYSRSVGIFNGQLTVRKESNASEPISYQWLLDKLDF